MASTLICFLAGQVAEKIASKPMNPFVDVRFDVLCSASKAVIKAAAHNVMGLTKTLVKVLGNSIGRRLDTVLHVTNDFVARRFNTVRQPRGHRAMMNLDEPWPESLEGVRFNLVTYTLRVINWPHILCRRSFSDARSVWALFLFASQRSLRLLLSFTAFSAPGDIFSLVPGGELPKLSTIPSKSARIWRPSRNNDRTTEVCDGVL
jgi:hypothetical protein